MTTTPRATASNKWTYTLPSNFAVVYICSIRQMVSSEIRNASIQFQIKIRQISVLQNAQNLFISRCCFAKDGKEMYKDLQRTCRAIVLLIKPFVLWCSRCRCHCRPGFLKLSEIFQFLIILHTNIVNRGEWLWSPANIKGANKDANIYVGRSTTLHNLFLCAHTLCMNYVIKTFLLVSSSVGSKQPLCFMHGQSQKREQNIQQNHSPLFTMIPKESGGLCMQQFQHPREVPSWRLDLLPYLEYTVSPGRYNVVLR